MKKYILEYYKGDPDTMSEYDDNTDKYIRSWYYDSSPGISFGWFQTTLDGGKEFVFGEDTCHYNLTQEIGQKIVGKAAASEDIENEDICGIGYAVNDTSAFKGRTFSEVNVITTWHKVSSEKLYEILENIGGIEKFADYEYVYPKEYAYSGNEEIEGGHMNVIDYVNSNDQYISPSDSKHMEMDIKGTYSFPDWMVDIVREYNAPNSKLAAKTEKLGNMTIAQYNSLIHQEGKEGKEAINEYFGGNPDTIYRYDYSKNKSGTFGKLNGLYNKLTNNRIYSPKHFREAYFYNGGNAIAFGYFQDSINGQKSFKKIENGTHFDIVMKCTETYVRNAKSRIGYDGIARVRDAIMQTSACKGRVFLEPKVIATWGVVTSARLKEIVNLLGIENPQEYSYVINRIKDYNLLKYINGNNINTDGDGDEERFNIKIEDIDSKKLQKYLLIIKDYNFPSSKLVDKSKKLGNMTIAQYNSLIHQENKEGKKAINEYFVGDPDSVFDTERAVHWQWDDKNTICFGYFPVTIDNDYEFLSSNKMHLMLAKEASTKMIGKASSHISEEYKHWIANECYNKSYGLGRCWLSDYEDYPNIMSFWVLPSSNLLKDIVSKLKIDPSKCVVVTENGVQSKMENITVLEYIESDFNGDDGKDSIELPLKIDKKIKDKIISYNKPNETWQSQKEKEGWKTLAQRNATIYQEEKKHKDIIKENNMKENKYQKEFSNYIEIMNEALKRNDFRAYNAARNMLEETIEDSKQEKALLDEMKTNNFGILNHIFEQQLPTLIKKNKKAVRDVIKTIKEDKNLIGQFNFYNVIKNKYKGDSANLVESKEALEKLAEISIKGINQETIKESNKKLKNVMLKNGIVPTEFVDEEYKKLYESGNIILTRKKTTANMMPLIESYHNVCQYMEKHKNDAIKENKNVDEMIREFEEKMKTNLNESEISFVKQITDFRTPIAEQRKEKLFNKFKNECLEKINSMLKEDTENSGLIDLSKQINEMTFDKNNIVKDIAKLLEIRDILMDD